MSRSYVGLLALVSTVIISVMPRAPPTMPSIPETPTPPQVCCRSIVGRILIAVRDAVARTRFMFGIARSRRPILTPLIRAPGATNRIITMVRTGLTSGM